jgi:hypothetical protein
MPPLPRSSIPTGDTKPLADIDKRTGENQAPQVARVLRAVTEDTPSRKGSLKLTRSTFRRAIPFRSMDPKP